MNNPKQMELINTIHVALIKSLRDVQETFFNSAITSSKKTLIFIIIIFTGQAGFEPATCGFGDRRSTSWSYWPIFNLFRCLLLLHLFVRRVLLVETAILAELNTLRLLLFVLHAGIIDALTNRALKMNDLSHKSCLCSVSKTFRSCAPALSRARNNWSPRPGLNR